MASTDLSRSAFYQYFDDVHHLMKTLLDMLAEEIFASVSLWFEGVGDPRRIAERNAGRIDSNLLSTRAVLESGF